MKGQASAATTGTSAQGLSLRSLTVRGSTWVALGYAAQQALRLGGNLILARLLFPEAFGLMALVNAAVQGLQMFSDLGLRPAVIHSNRGDQEELLHTAWALQALRGLLLWLIACAVAWPMAQLYDEPLLMQLLPVAGVTALILGLQGTSILSLNRRLAVGRIAAAQVAAQAVGLAVMVGLAWYWRSVWALAIGGVATSATLMILSHTLLRQQPWRLHFDKAAARELIRFGKWVFIATALTFLASQGDRLLLGGYVAAGMLGVYSIAFMLSEAVGKGVSKISHNVLMPAFSRVARENPQRLGATYQRARYRLAAAVLPAAGFLMTAGDQIVAVLYDARYIEAGWMLQVLSLRLVAYCLAPPAAVCLMALGKPQHTATASGAKAVCLLTGIPIGFAVAGLAGAIWAVALAEFAQWPLLLRGLRREGIITGGSGEFSLVPWLLLGCGAGWLLVLLN